jgi:hypothetical protein
LTEELGLMRYELCVMNEELLIVNDG